MNLKNKLKIIIMLSFVFIFFGTVKSFATSISVSPSKGTVSPGERFSVTISGSDATGRVNISASNGTVSQSSAWIENNSVVITVTAGNSGTVNISVSGEVSSNSGVDTNVSRSASVAIQAPQPSNNPGGNNNQGGNAGGNNNQGGSTGGNNNQGGNTATKDSNANLSKFGFTPSEYDTFKFNVNTLEYRVDVPNELSSITVYANAASGKAKVSGAGARNLKEGSNRIDVTVTAEAGNKKTYTLWINRAIGGDGEVPPNVIDEPEEEEPEAPKGLATFEITGYELDKEFKTDVYEYTAKTEEKITKEWLEEVKKKLVYTATAEGFVVEATTEVLEDEKGTITIVVKDGENEVAKYVITFEREKKEEEPVVALINTSDSGNTTGMFGLTFERMIYIILGIYGVTLVTAIFFAVDSYLKTRRLEEYDEEQEFEEDEEFEKMNAFYAGYTDNQEEATANFEVKPEYNENAENSESVDRVSEELAKEETAEETAAEVTSSLKRLGGYRNMRGTGKSSGRHF